MRKVVVGVASAIVTIGGAVGVIGSLNDWCSSRNEDPTALVRSPWLGLQVWQNETRNEMSLGERYASADRLVRVPMSNDPFELRFSKPPKEVAIQICAWTDDSI